MLVSKRLMEKLAGFTLPEEKLEANLIKAGFELENVQRFSPGFCGVVTAKIEEIRKHPNADRLSLCRVKSKDRAFSIVCGARNIHEGAIVPLALEGARLPKDVLIRRASIRGVDSEGMLCSQKELEVSQEHGGIWLLPKATPVGIPLEDALGIPDVIFDVSIPPNRGDCLSHFGLLREILLFLGEPPPKLPLSEGLPFVGSTPFEIQIEEDDGCRGYIGTLMENFEEKESPLWLSGLLLRLGMRSVDLRVDLTNYVLFEIGQPLHSFDADRLRGGRIRVGSGLEKKTFRALDEKTYEVPPGALWIEDGVGPVALAGIIGGADSMVTPGTKNILLEAARFDPIRIRKTARALKMSTDASFRFERGVTQELAPLATDRFLGMALRLSPGVRLYRPRVAGRFEEDPRVVYVEVSGIEKLLGRQIGKDRMLGILKSLGIPEEENGRLKLNVAPFRADIQRPCDVAEEVARFVGYDSFEPSIPKPAYGPSVLRDFDERDVEKELRAYMKSFGFQEVVTFPFVGQRVLEAMDGLDPLGVGHPIALENPLQATDPYLRTSLFQSLVRVLKTHTGAGKSRVRCFEIARVFGLSKEGEFIEKEALGAILRGSLTPALYERAFLFDPLMIVKGFAENALKQLGIYSVDIEPDGSSCWEDSRGFRIRENTPERRPLGVFGQLSPKALRRLDVKAEDVYGFEVVTPKLSIERTRSYRPFGRFPAVLRDASFIVPEELPYQELVRAIEGVRPELLASYELFDVYRGGAIPQGFKVYNVRYVYQSQERTLTDEEANALHFGFLERLTQRLPIELRT